MSFTGQTSSASSGINDVLADLGSLFSDLGGSTGTSTDGTGAVGTNPPQQGDSIGQSSNSELNALGLILEGLGELLQMLGGEGSGTGGSGTGGGGIGTGPVGTNPTPAAPNDPFFNSFSASDTGDPHLSFTGSEQNGTSSGQTVSNKWDNMNGQSDLLHADINGTMFQVSTDVGTPINGNGVTLNNAAQVSYGDDSVDVSNNGSVTLNQGGEQFQLQNGQSYTFGDTGMTVTDQNGNVTASVQGAGGAQVSTTISQGGTDAGQNYLNISASGNNVAAGGALVDGAAGTKTTGDAQAYEGSTTALSSFINDQEQMQLAQMQEQSITGFMNTVQQNTANIGGQNGFNPNGDFTDDNGGI